MQLSSSSSKSKRKVTVTFAVNDEHMDNTRPRVKMQRRNSKVGRMFFTDVKQARHELWKESTSINNYIQSNLPLNQLFSRKESNGVHRLRQLGLGESLLDDSPFPAQRIQNVWPPTDTLKDISIAPISFPLSSTDPSIEDMIFSHALTES